jgi:hypothetical protein
MKQTLSDRRSYYLVWMTPFFTDYRQIAHSRIGGKLFRRSWPIFPIATSCRWELGRESLHLQALESDGQVDNTGHFDRYERQQRSRPR